MAQVQRVEMEWAGKRLVLETGRMAKLAHGAVMVRCADTIVLATACAASTPTERDFLPLTVDFQERYYAAGKIPGGFFRREGRPTEKEVLTSRMIDRPHRPLFPKGYLYETQIICSVLSTDQSNVSDIIGIIASSAALTISDVPFRGPVGAVRIGRIGDRFLVNPDLKETEESDINLIVAGTREGIVMVEGGAREVPEAVMLQALELAHREIVRVIDLVQQLAAVASRPKRVIPSLVIDPQLRARVHGATQDAIRAAILIPDKTERKARLNTILEETLVALDAQEAGEARRHVTLLFNEFEKSEVRRQVLERGTRADGRTFRDIRPISCEVGILPRAHGSALFTRGETQSLTAVTLGTVQDEQKIDALDGAFYKTFMLHYNFPPFSVGEVRPMRGSSRREIGHGVLAERALKPVLPTKEQFPYTLRIVSDILESNGSSSMATVCASTLAMMDAGVPVRSPVAGIAMGLIKEGERVVILSDILGVEDQLGDMDFKVAGTAVGITALQMDMKIPGITTDLMRVALEQGREGRLFILKKMSEALAAPRPSLSPYAPRILTIQIRPSKIGAVIGPGGKMIRSIVEKTGAKIDVADDGVVTIASIDDEAAQKAVAMINSLTQEVEVGRIYQGTVKRVMPIGAIVELGPNMDGLCHISELAPHRVNEVTDIVREGDAISVKVLEVDPRGKIRLSRKAALPPSTEKSGGR